MRIRKKILRPSTLLPVFFRRERLIIWITNSNRFFSSVRKVHMINLRLVEHMFTIFCVVCVNIFFISIQGRSNYFRDKYENRTLTFNLIFEFIDNGDYLHNCIWCVYEKKTLDDDRVFAFVSTIRRINNR